MKKDKIKDMIRPIVEECVKEMFFEGGVLSGIIKEVVNNMPSQPSTGLVAKSEAAHRKFYDKRIQEEKKPVKKSQHESYSSLSQRGDPNDPGVNIDNLFATSAAAWQKLK